MKNAPNRPKSKSMISKKLIAKKGRAKTAMKLCVIATRAELEVEL